MSNFSTEIVRIAERKVEYTICEIINVYKCNPIVARPPGDSNLENGFDLYLHSDKFEILICFSWISPNKFKKMKHYGISGVTDFEALCLSGLVISEYLIGALGYTVENWK